MKRKMMLLALLLGAACGSLTEPCIRIKKGTVLATFKQYDHLGQLIQVDSLRSEKDFEVCK